VICFEKEIYCDKIDNNFKTINMKDEKDENEQNLDTENTENVENTEEQSEDVIFEDLNQEGEEMSEVEKAKKNKINLEEKYKDKIEKLEKERDEYLAGWQRALSDYKNLSKRSLEEKKDWGALAVKDFIEELFPVLDTYDAAKSNGQVWESVDKDWRLGIEYIFDLFEQKIADRSIERFGKVGDIYEANSYEALENIETNEENKNQTIAQVISSGYKYKNNLLRPAKVKVYLMKK